MIYTRAVATGTTSEYVDFGMYNMDLAVQMPTHQLYMRVAGKELSGTVYLKNLGLNYTNGTFDTTLHMRQDTSFDSALRMLSTL